jgi:outer membrane protein TolC
MIVAWCAIALALVGADDPQAITGKSPGPSVTIKIEIGGSPGKTHETPKVTVVGPAVAGAGAACCMKQESETAAASQDAACKQQPPAAKRAADEPQEVWPLTLQQAIRIGLDNSEIVRVIAFGQQGIPVGNCFGSPPQMPEPLRVAEVNGAKVDPDAIVIARLNADAAKWRFQSEIMAHVRSVEQQYWNLAQAHAALWAADMAVTMAKQAVDREQAELEAMPLCHGPLIADLAEATQRLEQFNLDLVTKTSDVITCEHQLRFLLGLPESDNRRIVPVTSPNKELVSFDWNKCLAEMLCKQPDIIQQKALVKLAKVQLLIAKDPSLPQLNVSAFWPMSTLNAEFANADDDPSTVYHKYIEPLLAKPPATPSTNSSPGAPQGAVELPSRVNTTFDPKQAEASLERSQEYLKQVLHQTTHSLARFFLMVDAEFKQYRAAADRRAAVAKQLETTRDQYASGEVTADRFLDDVSNYATAVALEHRFLANYNTAVAAVAEAKATLLEDKKIVIAEPRKKAQPKPAVAAAKKDEQTKPASFTPAVSEPAKGQLVTDESANRMSPLPKLSISISVK